MYRGFLADTDKLTFVTDHRTEKLEEFGHQSWAEVQSCAAGLQHRMLSTLTEAVCRSAGAAVALDCICSRTAGLRGGLTCLAAVQVLH